MNHIEPLLNHLTTTNYPPKKTTGFSSSGRQGDSRVQEIGCSKSTCDLQGQGDGGSIRRILCWLTNEESTVCCEFRPLLITVGGSFSSFNLRCPLLGTYPLLLMNLIFWPLNCSGGQRSTPLKRRETSGQRCRRFRGLSWDRNHQTP